MIKIIENIDLINDITNYDIILIGTNIFQIMGNGFQRKIRTKYPETYQLNMDTKYGDTNKLGKIVSTNNYPIFTLCFITKDYNSRPDLRHDYLNYKALEECIKTVNIKYAGLNVATTMIGCSEFDGNGDKERVLNLLKKNSDNINLFIYDYVQIKREVESAIRYLDIVNNENYDKEKKTDLINKIKEEDKKLYSLENPTTRFKRIKEEIKILLQK